MYYTLIQHSGYTIGGNPQFRAAVENASVNNKEAKKIIEVGGLVFNGYGESYDAAHKFNYPLNSSGLIPQADGSFKKVKDVGMVFVPSLRV